MFDPKIFHDYDVRGVYPSQINEEIYQRIGMAIADYIGQGPIGAGHDMRLSSPTLSKALIKGILSQGIDVVDLGLISSEMLYFASGKYRFPANVIISASHNPPQYNGLKVVKKGVVALNGEYGLPQIRALALKNQFPQANKFGQLSSKNILDDWITHALKFVELKNIKPLKVVVDAGNGMAGISWQKLIGRLPIEIIPLYFKPDGSFPHHIPNPLEEKNLLDLKNEIIEKKADLGLSFDGDADRLFILDEKTQVLSGTITTAILAKHLLKTQGAKNIVLYNAVCGRIVPETVEECGGKSIRVRVGHSFIKQYMRKYHALFAGEHSGHYYFRDNYNAESSLLAALIFLEFVSSENKKVSQIVEEFAKYPQSGELNFKAQNIEKIVKTIKMDYQKSANSLDDIDGLSIWYSDWWFNIRASKTEPLLRLNIEADNQSLLDRKQKELVDKLLTLGATL